jgi:ribosomal protein S18 acetylase RimI-like enzyme
MDAALITRSMTTADLPFAAQCIDEVGWMSEDRTTLGGIFTYDPQGCMIAESNGQPAGVCMATAYGRSGFIGKLIVRAEARGQGIGAALLNHCMDYLRQRGAVTAYLDGVIKAAPLYERNGFRKVCHSLRFNGKLTGREHADVRLMQPTDLPAVCALDRRLFGENRSYFLARRLRLYPDLCHVLSCGGAVAGYIVGRRGEGWQSAGPWVAAESVPPTESVKLLESFAYHLGNLSFGMGVLEANAAAVALVRALGFEERADYCWRMANGPAEDLGMAPGCLAIGSAATG